MTNETLLTIGQAGILLALFWAWMYTTDGGKKHTTLSWAIGCAFWWCFYLFQRIGWPIVVVVVAAYYFTKGLNKSDSKHHGHRRQNKRVVN